MRIYDVNSGIECEPGADMQSCAPDKREVGSSTLPRPIKDLARKRGFLVVRDDARAYLVDIVAGQE